MGAPFDRTDYYPLVTYAYEQLSLSTAISSFTSTLFAPPTGGPALAAIVTLEGDSARYRMDAASSLVSTALGHPMLADDQVVVWGSVDVGRFRIVGQSASAKANVDYLR